MLMMFGFEVELKHNKLWFLLLALAGVGHRVQVVQHHPPGLEARERGAEGGGRG